MSKPSALCRHPKTRIVTVEVKAVPQRTPHWKAQPVTCVTDVEMCEVCGERSRINFDGQLVVGIDYRMQISSPALLRKVGTS